MEQRRTHDKKKNTKTMPVALNVSAGAGSFGIGGIVLLGGALVTATIVSVLAFKRKKQHQSSSNIDNKNMSTETQTVDVSNQLELMMKDNKDFSADFSPLENPSDGGTRIKEMETKTIQNLTKDEKHNSGIGNDEEVESEDSDEDVMFSVDAEGQAKASADVDPVFEIGKVENSYEKVMLGSEELVIMETQIEDNSCLKKEDGGEEKKYSTIIDNGNDELADAKSLVSDESVTSIEEYEAIEVPLKDDVAKASGRKDEGGENQETVFMNEEAGTEAVCVNHVRVDDDSQEQFFEEKEKDDKSILENCEGNSSDETGYADQVVRQAVMEKEATDAACTHQNEVQNSPQVEVFDCQNETVVENCERDSSMECISGQITGEDTNKAGCGDVVEREDILEMADHELALDVQEKLVNKDPKTFVIACVINSLKEAVDDQTTVKEDNPPNQFMSEEEQGIERAQKVEEQVTIEDEVVIKCEMPHTQLIEEAEVDDQTVKIEDNPPRQLVNEEEKEDITVVQVEVKMITEDELVKERISKEDEIPHVKSIEEDVKEKCIGSSDELEDSSMTRQPKISNHNNEEDMEEVQTILGREQNDSDQNGIIKEENGNKSASKFLIELAKAKKQVLASEPWNLKLMTWSLLVSIWCLCHWYSELPYPKLSLVGSLLFGLILLGYQNRTTYLV